jgi:hypothetical protein
MTQEKESQLEPRNSLDYYSWASQKLSSKVTGFFLPSGVIENLLEAFFKVIKCFK